MKKRILAAVAFLFLCGTATQAYAMYAEEEAAVGLFGIRTAWKDADGFCPAGCDASKYNCPCVIITAD